MARPGRPERNRAARSFRQFRRFHHVINSDKVFGTHSPNPNRHLDSLRYRRWQRLLAGLGFVSLYGETATKKVSRQRTPRPSEGLQGIALASEISSAHYSAIQ